VKKSEKIWYEYHTNLATFIRSRVAEDAVDDLLQDVFMRIHSRLDSLNDNAKLESWLYQITRNAITDYYRSQRKIEEFPEWTEQPQPEEAETIRKELSSCLEPMIQELPDKYRNAIHMSELENKTQQEVAEQEGISLSGAKSRVQRGRALLKGILEDCCQFELNQKNQILSYEKKKQNGKC
jgi:RNA polymerase sigma-70 factor, ECF subfamily